MKPAHLLLGASEVFDTQKLAQKLFAGMMKIK
jgi:hypothetical protein